MEAERIYHEFPPFFDRESRILILGSFPSVRSREISFYYGHPRNRFWPVIGRLFQLEIPPDTEGRKNVLSRCHIALWDVIESCRIRGSQDSSIRDPKITDLSMILDAADIRGIYLNGKKAADLYERWQKPAIGRSAAALPSTSPANAAWSLDRLCEAWSVILQDAPR